MAEPVEMDAAHALLELDVIRRETEDAMRSLMVAPPASRLIGLAQCGRRLSALAVAMDFLRRGR